MEGWQKFGSCPFQDLVAGSLPYAKPLLFPTCSLLKPLCETLTCEVCGTYTDRRNCVAVNIGYRSLLSLRGLESDPKLVINKFFLLSKFASPHFIILEMCFSNQTN